MTTSCGYQSGVSPYRDRLDPHGRARYDQAIAEAARIYVRGRHDRDMLAAAQGTRAVAEAV